MKGGLLHPRLQLYPVFCKISTPVQCRFYAPPATIDEEALGPTRQDGHQTFRVRKDGKPLPLPPVLDPVVISERGRWEQRKARPNVKNLTPFQQKLHKCSYAHALASPVRQCRSTFLLLPSAFLITLHPRPHPKTSEPWLLPVSLTASSRAFGPPFRFLGRKIVVLQLGQKEKYKSGVYQRLVDKLGSKAYNMVWRQDMADMILSLLQKALMSKLGWHFRRCSKQLVDCNSPSPPDVEAIDDISCVLYLRSLKSRADGIQEQAYKIVEDVEKLAKHYAEGQKEVLDPHKRNSASHYPPSWWKGPIVPHLNLRLRFPPLEFMTTEWRGQRVAVYSLFDLLGEEKMRELLQGTRFEWAKCVVIKRGRSSVAVEVLLMQLQAFLAVPGP